MEIETKNLKIEVFCSIETLEEYEDICPHECIKDGKICPYLMVFPKKG